MNQSLNTVRHGLSPTPVHVVFVVDRVVWDSFPPSTLIVPCRYRTTNSLTYQQCTLILATEQLTLFNKTLKRHFKLLRVLLNKEYLQFCIPDCSSCSFMAHSSQLFKTGSHNKQAYCNAQEMVYLVQY